MASVKIDKLIAEHRVVIFSKSRCPYCTKVKALFQDLGIAFFMYELDLEDDGDELQTALKAKTGQRTVPNVFVNSTHVGGCDDTTAAKKSGKLEKLLNGPNVAAASSEEANL